MLKNLCSFLVPLMAVLWPSTALAQNTDRYIQGPITADVIEVIDGDTIAVKLRPWLYTEITTRLRIRGIDTPEVNSAKCSAEAELGAKATQHVVDLLLSDPDGQTTITVQNITPDKYSGRVIAEAVAPNGTDIASSLLDAQLAQPYSGGTRPQWCA